MVRKFIIVKSNEEYSPLFNKICILNFPNQENQRNHHNKPNKLHHKLMCLNPFTLFVIKSKMLKHINMNITIHANNFVNAKIGKTQ
jgi:hypothetical protein